MLNSSFSVFAMSTIIQTHTYLNTLYKHVFTIAAHQLYTLTYNSARCPSRVAGGFSLDNQPIVATFKTGLDIATVDILPVSTLSP